jgi:metal-dependent amidase/aminoacylase/carboxypeptidase family protein
MRTNFTLAELFSQNLQLLGRTPRIPNPNELGGSADLGNVSQLAPAIHAWIAITSGARPHDPEFASAAASEEGMQALIDGAKALALTVVDLLAAPDIRVKIKEEFQGKK